MLKLLSTTDPAWTEAVLSDFDAFLLDHATCERKASATGMSLICHYPDRSMLVREMIAFAQEELDHFAEVMAVIEQRGLVLRDDKGDPYVRAMLSNVRDGTDAYFLDRLLVAGVVEARGCERFGLLADALRDESLAKMYRRFANEEARHHTLFIKLAREYFDRELVDTRLAEILDEEAAIVQRLPHRAALH